jgi:hypothetical protein
MIMSSLDKIKSRIKKLFALSKSPNANGAAADVQIQSGVEGHDTGGRFLEATQGGRDKA